MFKTIRERFWNWRVVLVTTPSVTLAVILLRLTGILQTLELGAYDQYMRWRPPEARDSRIVIVGIDEDDLKFIGQGYVPDGVYFELIQRLNAMNPRVIGLDIYRDLPFEPGHSQLVRLFETTDNLIGIEKVIGDHFFSRVGPPPALAARGQVGANDLIVDQDNRVRRALLYLPRENGETVHSFAVHLALRYLNAEPDFSVEIVEGTDNWWKFGDVVFVPFEGNDGGYVRADDGGYQVLLNYRGPSQHFEIVSMRDIFENRVASDWGSDRIILIGSVGESMKDLFSIPYTLAPDQRMTGVEIHANIVSKIISAALENRPLIRTLPEVVEWLLIMFWSGLGATLTWRLRDPTRVGQFLFKRVVILVLAGGILLGFTWVAFLGSWWLPVVPSSIALVGSVAVITAYIARSASDIRKTFGRYLSDEIVANLLEHPEGLKMGGERRKITILTSDLRGFTALSERLPPEEVVQVLNFYLSYMADVITHYQGTIDEFMGDGILVLFGAPTLREDDPERAVACAVAMQLAMAQVNEQMEKWELPALEMGIGINTGEVVVGNLGSEKRTKYGVVGSHVNLTYRIESYTTGGQIIISEETLNCTTPNWVKIDDKKLVQPKGVKNPIAIYEVSGIAGKYNLFLPKETEIFYSLSQPISLQYTVLEGKHVGENLFSGRLLQLSDRSALIGAEDGTDSLPLVLTNIKLNLKSSNLELREDIYAKVLEKPAEPGKFYIRFTSKPPVIEAKLNDIYQMIKG
ncbi:MAG: adenylate/guanylate cyclase domain-containing protein [Limnospira sp. PMC 1291.21]|uniref:Adenylate/guanylate cyclase domain-containing protein n=1 Tax=Limnospira fusiformis PMC 851.14 TaxID=2219512 RepID=A0ABU9EE20_LIMFS|nr:MULTISPECIES: adenylate/guanylate cyclase domain-containing protein [unclassified Limnospira]MDY7053334.1 adenylate/guanylate cyclase domain-containing protein [Limnospira fusiformis LS22]MDT9178841.1 adenylate/guanylate cyclase domain-containing protein [Limnospira sp. PMC 1238.20]MDT9192946.1 adenylate/guanylate cyclase domain-containing protein [Limnospira sp. PMC 1245.20]MDT9203263.1 adenylate/guanylate cyclase domain-containing protein [Limnospira sp. PMC 1243.20]MDT9209461.1 adenylate